ncbi:P-loop containing nucleoside triphosphate hydrolase [Balamuthia mandrillaris]
MAAQPLAPGAKDDDGPCLLSKKEVAQLFGEDTSRYERAREICTGWRSLKDPVSQAYTTPTTDWGYPCKHAEWSSSPERQDQEADAGPPLELAETNERVRQQMYAALERKDEDDKDEDEDEGDDDSEEDDEEEEDSDEDSSEEDSSDDY